MRIALCCNENSEELKTALDFYGDVVVFSGEWDRPPSVQLAEHITQGELWDLVVVALDGAAGMNDCRKIKNHKKNLPILWISDQDAFWSECRRMGVEEFLVKPVPEGMLQKVVGHLLEKKQRSEHTLKDKIMVGLIPQAKTIRQDDKVGVYCGGLTIWSNDDLQSVLLEAVANQAQSVTALKSLLMSCGDGLTQDEAATQILVDFILRFRRVLEDK